MDVRRSTLDADTQHCISLPRRGSQVMQPIKRTAIGLSRFTLHRQGEFTLMTFGLNHCGTKARIQVKYDLRVTCTVDSLDNRGFLFDQVAIAGWFDKGHKSDLSCEQFTLHCGRELYKLILRQNGGCHITHFALCLSPEPFVADLTFEYG